MADHPYWPLFDLRLRTPRLELRVPTDDDLAGLIAVARAGIHGDDEMPFLLPWSVVPSPEFERGCAQFFWRTRGAASPAEWEVVFGVYVAGEPIGVQGIDAVDFAALRQAETGSWLGRDHQGEGYGTEMRAAILALGFDGLGARAMRSGYRAGNEASRRVSERLGYRPNGVRAQRFGDGPAIEHLVLLDVDTWRRERASNRPYVEVDIDGLEACRPILLGDDEPEEEDDGGEDPDLEVGVSER